MLLLAGVVVFAGYCLWQLWELRQEYTQLLQDEARTSDTLAIQRQILRDNQRQLDRLRNDPAYVDMVIRRRLGYAKPGELIFRFEQTDAALRPLPAANDR